MILPAPTDLSAPYWEGAREGELRLQWCEACDHCWHPPSPTCPRCRGREIEWRPSSGRGRVHSFTLVTHPVHPSFSEAVPYSVVLVELDEGPLVVTNLLECPAGAIRIGMPVEVRFEALDAEGVLPQFAPVTGPAE